MLAVFVVTEPLLKVHELKTWFRLRKWVWGHAGDVRALDGVSFSLARGESLAIVGESGCGKSTLAKTILALCAPTGGSVHFEGTPIEPANTVFMREYRAAVGYIQQDPFGALPPFMPVRRILEEPLIIHGIRSERERAERIRDALGEVKLPPDEYLEKFPHMLSGGQQQRIVIARAMILRPKLLIADEPVSMLDASVRIGILELLAGLQKSHNLGLIYITHDLSTVRHFAHRIFVMYAGRIIEKSDAHAILDEPLHPYTRALIAAIPDPEPGNAKSFRSVPPGEPPSLVHPPSACRFHPRCPDFINGLCDVEPPPEFEKSTTRSVLCWLHKPGS